MFNTKWDSARRAWKFLRHWKIQTRRRHRRPLPVVLRPVRRFIKRLVHPSGGSSTPLPPHYAERQFSFNDTPVFHLKLHRRPPPYVAAWFHLPWFSCINPKVEFENFVVDVGEDGGWDRRRLCGYGGRGDGGACGYEGEEEDDGIDLKAEKFIKMFYEEMKLQSQV